MRRVACALLALASCATAEQRVAVSSALAVNSGLVLTGVGATGVGLIAHCSESECSATQREVSGAILGITAGVATVMLLTSIHYANEAAAEITAEDCRLFCELGTAEQCAVLGCGEDGFE